MNSNCSNLLDLRNLQEQVKKAFCYQKLFWPFTVWMNCSSDLKNFANSWPSALNFKSFSRSLQQLFLTVGQNNFGNKMPFLNNSFIIFVLQSELLRVLVATFFDLPHTRVNCKSTFFCVTTLYLTTDKDHLPRTQIASLNYLSHNLKLVSW